MSPSIEKSRAELYRPLRAKWLLNVSHLPQVTGNFLTPTSRA